MITKKVVVEQVINVTLDETKFTPEFMDGFSSTIFPCRSLDAHMQHIAQLHARGIYDEFSTFIEGYGPPADMGISCKTTDIYEEVVTE